MNDCFPNPIEEDIQLNSISIHSSHFPITLFHQGSHKFKKTIQGTGQSMLCGIPDWTTTKRRIEAVPDSAYVLARIAVVIREDEVVDGIEDP